MRHKCRKAKPQMTDAEQMRWLKAEIRAGRVSEAAARAIWRVL